MPSEESIVIIEVSFNKEYFLQFTDNAVSLGRKTWSDISQNLQKKESIPHSNKKVCIQ